MTIAFRAAGTLSNINSTAPLVVAYPAGVASGDLLVIQATFASGTPTTPSGWTKLYGPVAQSGSGGNDFLYYKIAGGSEPSTVTISDAIAAGAAVMSACTGVDPTTPIDTYATAALPTSGTSGTTPSVTTTVADTMLLRFYTTWVPGEASVIGPGTSTEQYDATWLFNGIHLYLGTEIQAAIGASGARTGAFSASIDGGLGVTVALRPATRKTLGRTAASGGFENNMAAGDRVRVYERTLATAGHLEELWTYVRIAGGSCTFRCVIYDDDGASGEPGTLLAVGADQTAPVADDFAREALRGGAVLAPVDLPAGDYWLGIHATTSGGALLIFDDDGVGISRTSAADAFVGGASNPWVGTATSHPASSQRTWAVLSPITATYTDSRTATVTASGSGVEDFQPPAVTYTDSRPGTIIASGSGGESYLGVVVMQGQGQIAITVGPKPTPHDPQPGLGALLYNARGADFYWTILRVPPIAGGEATDIWTQTWDGRQDAYNPAWGPDGRVVFSAPGGTLVMADGDGTNPVAVESEGGLDTPSWSPDGATILAYDQDDIVAVDLADGTRRIVLAASDFSVNLGAQAWKPDQTQIAFTDRNANEVWVVNLDGTGLTEITPIGVGALAVPASPINFAAWSPDGDELAICDRNGLHVSDTEGNNARHIYTVEAVWSAAWSPDGKRLGMLNDDGIAVVNADGTGFAQVNTDSIAWFVDWSRAQPPIALTGVVVGAEPDPTTVTMTGSATIGLFADGALEYPDLPPRVSASFYDRWRSGLHIGNARPGQRVQVRRGRFHRRHSTWNGPPMNGVSIPGFSMARPWQPFWTPKTDYIDVPNVREVRLDQSLDQNGITTATLTIDNIYYRPEPGGQHSIKRGFLAPLRGYVGPGRTRLVDEQGEPVNEDPTWFSLLAQDAQITVHQSYGDQEIKTFTGLIDDVDIVSSPDVITITARDFGKVLTESHLYGWNKEWPAEGDTGFLLDPITFADPDDADDTHAAGENAAASSGSGADNVIDGDGDTSWTSDRHTSASVTEYVQVRLPQGRYNDFTVNVESDDMEMYVSLLPKNLKGDASPTRNDVAIADNQWVDGGSGSTVPGDNGGIRYLRHLTGIAKGSHRYHLTSDADDFRVGDDSILRLSFRNLDRVAGTGSARYAASVVAVRAWRRTLSAEARRRHWVLVDDASDVVRAMLRWAGFKEWEVENTGAPLSEKFIVNRGMTYMDVIKRMADVSGYTFFMADPTTKSNSLGMPTYRRTQTVTDAAPVVTVHDTDLLGPIDVRESDEPLAYIIRMRGRVAPNRGRTVGGDTTKRLMYVYQPPWTVRPGGNQLGGILRHVIHTDDLFKTMDDCKFAAFYLALNEALAALTATIQIPSNPGVQLDDHVEVFDLGTGVTSRLSVQQRSSQLTRSGEQTLWSMTLGGALVDTLDIQAVVRRINSAKRA